ncbi:MAG: sialidase family protein, partial [Vicinamibacteria bacterium]
MPMLMTARGALLALALLVVWSPGPGAQPAWPPAIAPVPSPAGANAGQPQLSVSERGVLLSWIERQGETAVLKFAERTATGWSTPRTIARGDDWFVNWADVPSALRLADGTLVAHWLQKSGPDTYAYDVRLSYSTDDGRTWARSFTPHHDGTQTEHGFASLFQMPGAGLGLVWLDGRAMAGGTHDAPKGAMSVRFGTFDGAWKQTAEMPVDLRVCECCPTAAVVTAEGPLVAYRNRSDEEVRDIYVSRFENGRWTTPTAVHDDGWQIPACPVNGPMLSASGRDVAVAWFTVANDVGQAYLAFSRDAGRTFGAPIRLDDGGSLGRVDVELLPDGSAVATWIEFADNRAQFRARRVTRDGARGAPVTVAGLAGSRASGYPRVARHG